MFRSLRFPIAVLVVGILAFAPTNNTAIAAEKVVMAEQFTATWCGYCPIASEALNMMIANYPDTFLHLKVHGGDAYASAWGNSRMSFYGVGGYPDVWFGGSQEVSGVASSLLVIDTYNLYVARYNAIHAQATDVLLDIGAVHVTGETYSVSVRVTLEATGTAKDVRLHVVQMLDHYPALDPYYRNFFVQAAPTQTLSLTPDEYVEYTYDFTLTGASAADHANVRFLAWTQATNSSAPATIHQATMMTWPFTELPPPPAVLGDLDGTKIVDLDDVPAFILALLDPAAYAVAYPDVDPLRNGDTNEDEAFNALDIPSFIDIITYDTFPPTPNPMTWASVPAPISTTAISMTATTAFDYTGVEYLFANNSGAALSAWQSSPTFVHQNLNKNFPYAYKVKARDLSPEQNETAYSTPSINVATAIETPTGITISNVTSDAMDVTANGTFSNLTFGNSGLYFEMTPDVAGSGANVWITQPASTTLHVTGLDPDTEYTFRVKAVNFFGENETPYTAPVSQFTAP